MALLTVSEAAMRYGLSPEHLRRLARAGTIKAQRFGSLWQLDSASIEAYLALERRPGPPKKGA